MANELGKPSDCTDLANEEEARNEVTRLRKMIRDNKHILESASDASGKDTPSGSFCSPSRTRPADLTRFDQVPAETFHLKSSPELSDYLTNEFYRFQVSTSDQVNGDLILIFVNHSSTVKKKGVDVHG